jgi:hypothetical protein
LNDGKEVRFYGQVFSFLKGVQQRRVICYLHSQHLRGKREVATEKIVADLGLPAGTRIRDLFRKSSAWDHLLTEKRGVCRFCWPDHEK